MSTGGGALSHYVAAVAGSEPHGGRQHRAFAARTVKDVMNRTPVVAHRDETIRELAVSMDRNGVSLVPVVDDDSTVLGVVSVSDLLARVTAGARPARSAFPSAPRRFGRRRARARTAGELMSRPPITTTPSTSVSDAARTAAVAHVRGLPVVDHRGVLVGVVTREDLMRVFLRSDEDIREDVDVDVLRPLALAGHGRLTATVADGVVSLVGEVSAGHLARRAVHDTHLIPGVVDVRADELTSPAPDLPFVIAP